MPHCVSLPGGYQISDERARLDMEAVHRFLAATYWAATRPRALTERSWANCLCFGLYAPDGPMVGCGRLLTDFALRAHLGDVFIDPAHRGHGLGKALVETVLGHPELADVSIWTLTTGDAHALYARYGFVLDQADGRKMVLSRRPASAGTGASIM